MAGSAKAFDIILNAKDRMSGALRGAQANLSKFTDKIKRANDEFKKMNSLGKTVGTSMVKVGQSISAVGRTMTAAVTLPIAAGVGFAIKNFIDFEDQLLSVQETSELSGDALKSFGNDIISLTKRLPFSAEELLKISTEAGRIVELRDPQALIKFTEAIAKFSKVAGIGGDAATTSLSKILKLSNEPITDVEKLASSIVSLADSFNTTESKITDTTFALSKNIASRFGVSSQDIVALSAVMGNLGIDAGKGSVNVLKAFDKIGSAIRKGKGDELKELIRVTGMDFKELQKQFDTDAFGVFKQLLAGLERSKKGGEDLGKVLEKLKLGQGKTSAELSKLVDAYWDIVKAQDQVQSEYKNTIALDNEIAIKSKSLGERIQILKNKFHAFGKLIAERIVPIIEDKVIPALERMFAWFDKNPELADMAIKFGLIAAAIGPVLIAVGSLIAGIGNLILTGVFLKTSLAALGLTIGGIAIVALKFIAIAAAVAAVAILIYKNWEPLKKFFTAFWDSAIVRWLTGRMAIQWVIDNAETLKNAWQSVKDFFVSLWDSPIQKTNLFVQSLKAISWVLEKIYGLANDVSDAMSNMKTPAVPGLPGVIGVPGAQPTNQVASNVKTFSSPKLAPDRSFAQANIQKSVETKNAHVTVDFKNMPRGTSVTPTKNESTLDLNLGYASA